MSAHTKSVITGISFSYAENSMNTRGLGLMGLDYVYDMTDFNMPICNKNSADGKVLARVHNFLKVIKEADILVFAVPEATAHYSVGFKNAMDWIICSTHFNSDLGQDGPFSNKPIYVITFTPVTKNAGHRHFDMTRHLIEKMGGIVYDTFCMNNGWKECVPGNYEWVKDVCIEIFDHNNYWLNEPKERKPDMKDRPQKWVEQYKEWDAKWNS